MFASFFHVLLRPASPPYNGISHRQPQLFRQRANAHFMALHYQKYMAGLTRNVKISYKAESHITACKYFSSKPPQDLCYKRTIGLPLLMYISTSIAHPGMRTQAGLHAEIRHLPAGRRHDLVPWHFPWRKHGGCHYRYQFSRRNKALRVRAQCPFHPIAGPGRNPFNSRRGQSVIMVICH